MTPSWRRVLRLVIDSRAGIEIGVFGIKASSLMEVIKTGMYIEVGGTIPDFKVGGFVEMRLKIGDSSNYPVVYLGIGFELVAQRLILEGGLKGENDPSNCWRNAFKVTGLAICDIKISIGLIAPFPWISQFSFQGAIKIGNPAAPKFSFLIGIKLDPVKPSENCFIGQLNSTLSMLQLVEVGMGLVGVSVRVPNIPLFTLNSITIKIAGSDMTIAGQVFTKGLAFDVDMIILGIRVRAGFSFSETAISAYFSSTAITLLAPVLVLCKDSACRPNEGPAFSFIATWGGTPYVLIKLDAYINFLGVAMGVKVYVCYKDFINFRAEFYMRKLSLAGGALEIAEARAGGPAAQPAAAVLGGSGSCTGLNPLDINRVYSSVWGNEASGVGHGRGRIGSPQGWSSLHNAVGQYMQLNMGTLTTLCGVSMQGRADSGQWVTSFKVQVSTNCDSGSNGIYTDVDGGRIFNGNSDQATERQVLAPCLSFGHWPGPVVLL